MGSKVNWRKAASVDEICWDSDAECRDAPFSGGLAASIETGASRHSTHYEKFDPFGMSNHRIRREPDPDPNIARFLFATIARPSTEEFTQSSTTLGSHASSQ